MFSESSTGFPNSNQKAVINADVRGISLSEGKKMKRKMEKKAIAGLVTESVSTQKALTLSL